MKTMHMEFVAKDKKTLDRIFNLINDCIIENQIVGLTSSVTINSTNDEIKRYELLYGKKKDTVKKLSTPSLKKD